MTTAEKGADLTQRLLAFGRRQALHPEVLELGGVIGSLSDMLDRTLGNQVRLETQLDRRAAGLRRPRLVRVGDPEPGASTPATPCRTAASSRSRPRSSIATQALAGGLLPGDYVKVTVDRYRRGHDAGGARPRLRSVLHDEGRRQRLGHGPLDGLRLRQAVRRARQHREQDRRGHIGAPLSARVAARPKRGSRSRCGRTCPAACGHERILLVEDEPHVRRFVSNQLDRARLFASWRRRPARRRSTS